jgi:transposase
MVQGTPRLPPLTRFRASDLVHKKPSVAHGARPLVFHAAWSRVRERTCPRKSKDWQARQEEPRKEQAMGLHAQGAKCVKRHQKIVIDDVRSSKLAGTRMAKSVPDAAWGIFKMQVLYKGQQTRRCVEVISERFTTQACSRCGDLTGPRGASRFVAECGDEHDRDVNAAKNTLARAQVSLARPAILQTEEGASVSRSRLRKSERRHPPSQASSRCEAGSVPS